MAIALACLTAAPRAQAYVRYTSDGVSFSWPQSCVAITAYPAEFVEMMPLEESENAATQAAAAWSSATNTCTYLTLSVAYSNGAAPRAVNDHRNSLIFRVKSWCELQADGSCADDATNYDVSALAVTSVVAAKQTGEIRDADIEVNAADHHWTDVALHPDMAAGYQDLQNALTHEMGHLIGLDHSCYQPASGVVHPLDDTGNPAPDCNQAPAEIRDSSMFPSATPGDLEKRDLSSDDQKAVCDIYPVANNPMVCDPGATGGSGACSCSAAPPRPAELWGWFALALIALRRSPRRRAASAVSPPGARTRA
jgi:MYXO-CTERM domain-containing protein